MRTGCGRRSAVPRAVNARAPSQFGGSTYVFNHRILDLCPLCGPGAVVLQPDGVLRRVSDPVHAGHQADPAALPDEVQEEHGADEPDVRKDAGDPEEIRQQPAEDAGGDAEVLSGRGLQPHERLPVELPAPAHPDGPVLYHPGAHRVLYGLRRERGRSGRCGKSSGADRQRRHPAECQHGL